MRVLIVDPDVVMSRQMVASFISAGHDTIAAHTIADAVNYLDNNKVDAVVLELHIPVHNGVEFMYELRSYTDWQTIPIVVYSYANDRVLPSVRTQQQLGIQAFLSKTKHRLRDVIVAVEATTINV